jgi:hypothetical protein
MHGCETSCGKTLGTYSGALGSNPGRDTGYSDRFLVIFLDLSRQVEGVQTESINKDPTKQKQMTLRTGRSGLPDFIALIT